MRTTVPGPCPSCNSVIEYIYHTENIPYFSDILIISAACPCCGYRFVDTQMLKDAGPVRYELPVDSEADLSVRIVRSMSASLEIPELGVRIDPGPSCTGFVSNVEGILDRIDHIVRGALLWGNVDERENARALLASTVQVRNGTLPVTIILEDPQGNSAIVSDKAKKSAYSPETDTGRQSC